jgi:hypothetical protein
MLFEQDTMKRRRLRIWKNKKSSWQHNVGTFASSIWPYCDKDEEG